MIAQAGEARERYPHRAVEKEFRIRYRIDGVLFNQEPPSA